MNELVDSAQVLSKNGFEKFNSGYQENIEILKNESMSLLEVYSCAIKCDPRLSEVVIVPVKLDEKGKINPFSAHRPWKTKSGKAEVHILFGDSKSIEQIAINIFTENPEFEQQFRSWTFLKNNEEISPQLARAFTLLHELGHVSDFYDNITDHESFDKQATILKDNLPLGYLSTPRILQKYNSGDTEFQRKVQYYYGTIENAVVKYRQVKHQLSFEKKADEFAQDVLQRNPSILIALKNNLYKN